MNENVRKRNAVLAQTVIKGLESRNMTGYYAKNKEEALKQALEIIGEGSTVAMGGCQSANEIGLIQALNEGNYHYIDQVLRWNRAKVFWRHTMQMYFCPAQMR